MELTTLIINQAKTFAVMLAAGILIESMWQGKRLLQKRMKVSSIRKSAGFLAELIFWAAAATVLSAFLYYCAYGKPSLHAAVGFFVGLLLWKKILSYGILYP